MTEDAVVGWHYRLNGHKFEQTPGDGEGQGSLACCSPWGRKESDTTERLNNNTATILVQTLMAGVHDILPNDLPAFALRFVLYVLKTAGRGILVRCKSGCASPMLKPPVAPHLTWSKSLSGYLGKPPMSVFLSHCSCLHSLCSHRPVSDSRVTHGHGVFALAASSVCNLFS